MRGATPCITNLSTPIRFQSTRPMRGATSSLSERFPVISISIHAPHAGRDTCFKRLCRFSSDFNPRAPCGARLTVNAVGGNVNLFQSTRPMRGATVLRLVSVRRGGFQSTRPMRGATQPCFPEADQPAISIHAPHAGRDGQSGANLPPLGQISIHAPHAGRDQGQGQGHQVRAISIHAPHAGRDGGPADYN